MAVKTFDLSVILKMVDRFSNPMKQSMLNFNNFIDRVKKSESVLKKFGTGMRNVGGKLSMYATAPLAILGGLALRTALNFDSAMNMVGAVTRTQIGDTVLPAFTALREEAKRLGSTTQFTASQVAGGMQFLGMAGMDAATILKVIPNVLELAASAQMDMADAANIVTNIMASQQMKAEDLSRVNDVLVSSFTKANVNLHMLGEAFKYAGNVTRDAGVSVEEAAAAFGLMGQQGIQASLAGTSLRGAFARMMAPSGQLIKQMKDLGMKVYEMKNGVPVLKSLVDIVREFEKAGADSGDMIQMFGLRAGPGFAALVSEGSDKLEKFIDLMKKDVGIASSIAKAQMIGLPGAVKELASAWEGLQLAIMETGFGKAIIELLRGLASFLRQLNQTNPKLLEFAAYAASIVAILGPLLIGLGLVAFSLGAIGAALGITAGSALLLIGGIVLAGAIMAGVVYLILKHWEKIKQFFIDLPKMIVDGFKWMVRTSLEIIKNLVDSIYNMLDSVLPEWVIKYSPLGAIKGAVDIANNKVNPVISGAKDRSEADITVRVMADQNSSAQVEDIKKKGNTNLNVMSDNYLGENLMAYGL